MLNDHDPSLSIRRQLGVKVIKNYKNPFVFFIIFLGVLTLPLTINASLSYFQTERITRDVGVALSEYFDGNGTRKVVIKDIWIKKLTSFLTGAKGFEYGFDYYSEDQWKKYECRSEGNSKHFTFSINDDFTCSSSNNLVYDNNANAMVQIHQNDIYKDYSFKALIWDDFEKQLLLLYGFIVLVIDMIITLVWIIIRFIKGKIKVENY
ncbi:hypothetical protein [Paenibacillus guangzhouensis]|uniref:hypothetical protein n=1 Tax=Paenibacillus guangzhouensis TaxID=1473112 RepID=UPI001267165E|nr:hypothetical protein [Paenibacillus guangzhouensis]